MRQLRIWLLATAALLTLHSCIKDELLNQECDITGAWIEGDEYADFFYHPAQMRQKNISSSANEIVFTVKSVEALPDVLPVFFTLTPGATMEPANGSAQNFKNGPVRYTVTSQDGAWQRHYKVIFQEAKMHTQKYSFEHYETVSGANNNLYHVFYEVDENGTRHDIWASANPGAIIIKSNSKAEDQPTYSTANGYEGRGVCLNTQGTGKLGTMFGKPIAAGNLFLGHFLSEHVLTSALKSTEFGVPTDRVPLSIKGYYKYRPGEEFTDASLKIVPGRVDEASIYAVFFRNTDSMGNEIHLYGDDVLTNANIVKIAQVASLPPTNEWTPFEMTFKGGDVDVELLASQGYSMTLVFSSSKYGDFFEGAIGSTLFVDEVEITFE